MRTGRPEHEQQGDQIDDDDDQAEGAPREGPAAPPARVLGLRTSPSPSASSPTRERSAEGSATARDSHSSCWESSGSESLPLAIADLQLTSKSIHVAFGISGW